MAESIDMSLQPMRASNISMCHPGEVTLTGRVLPIGGVKEKSLAARRSGVKTLIFPKANKYDYDELTGDSIPHENPSLKRTRSVKLYHLIISSAMVC